ncbi:MAG: CopG family transcriptional regulator [Rhizonema sp. NSF051]|nr:CopG family transcriptional regulator [Rhizonema sp. NSF051]
MKKKWAVKRVTINLTCSEARKLDRYCSISNRTVTDVIRELIRSLPHPL